MPEALRMNLLEAVIVERCRLLGPGEILEFCDVTDGDLASDATGRDVGSDVTLMNRNVMI